MATPSPTTPNTNELLRANMDELFRLFNHPQWKGASQEHQSSILHVLKVSVETSLKLAEVARIEAVRRNKLANAGVGEETAVCEKSERAELGRVEEDAQMKKMRMDTERLKVETAKLMAEEERYTVQLRRDRAVEAYTDYVNMNSRY